MATIIIVVVVVIILAALVVGGIMAVRRRRTRRLQQQFGPEYETVLKNSESRSEAESTLSERKKRHDSLELTPLDPTTRERYRQDWERIQGSFVDDPGGAVEHADSLVTSIMRERGYPLDDFDQRADDISVEHPRVVENYRQARRVQDAHRRGSAGTDELREAVTSYRNLVEALLDEDGHDGPTQHQDEPRGGDRDRSGQHKDDRDHRASERSSERPPASDRRGEGR